MTEITADSRHSGKPSARVTAQRITPQGLTEPCALEIACEMPIAIELDGLGYAVMMATPVDLDDFVRGFVISERLMARTERLVSLDIATVDHGMIIRARLPGDRQAKVLQRARSRVSESSCGLCGLESLEQVARPLPPVGTGAAIADEAIFHALDRMPGLQPLNQRTGAMHAAAFCEPSGAVLLLREDVGRHNALDKLIGALLARGVDPASGFILTTSRCSYEIVEKSVLAGATTLVTMSAATSMAAERACAAGLRLIALARPDSALDMGV